MTLEENTFGPPHRVVAVESWHDCVAELEREGYSYFDWLSAVDEHPEGFRLVLHVVRLDPLDHLLQVTYLDRESPSVASIADIYAGAGWHERETHEMFGIDFGIALDPLLLPDGFEGHPLRKEFVLASRVAKAWPGAKEPGESDADSRRSPGRRRIKPPGVPDPADWGPAALAGRVGRGTSPVSRPDDASGLDTPPRSSEALDQPAAPPEGTHD